MHLQDQLQHSLDMNLPVAELTSKIKKAIFDSKETKRKRIEMTDAPTWDYLQRTKLFNKPKL